MIADTINTSSIKIDSLSTPHPIKQIQEFPLEIWEWAIILFLILGLLSILYGVVRQLRSKKGKKLPLRNLVENPHQWAEKKMHQIMSNPTIMTPPYKEYFVQISEIMREFVFKISKVDAPRNTSSTVLEEFQKENMLGQEKKQLLATLLQMADQVKFSQKQASKSYAEEFGRLAIKFIKK
jgi:hypothetical protein